MPASPEPVGRIRPDELKARLVGGDSLVLIDVRRDDERAFAAIVVSPPSRDVHIAMDQVVARVDEIRALAEAAPLVVYCHHGVRSLAVAEWLAAQGIAGLLNLSGGIDEWSTAVDPAVRRY